MSATYRIVELSTIRQFGTWHPCPCCCDDLYHPKSAGFIAEFSESELKDLAHLYGLLVEASAIEASSVAELLKKEGWRSVVKTAKNLSSNLT